MERIEQISTGMYGRIFRRILLLWQIISGLWILLWNNAVPGSAGGPFGKHHGVVSAHLRNPTAFLSQCRFIAILVRCFALSLPTNKEVESLGALLDDEDTVSTLHWPGSLLHSAVLRDKDWQIHFTTILPSSHQSPHQTRVWLARVEAESSTEKSDLI